MNKLSIIDFFNNDTILLESYIMSLKINLAEDYLKIMVNLTGYNCLLNYS